MARAPHRPFLRKQPLRGGRSDPQRSAAQLPRCGSYQGPASGFGQTQSYLNLPPYFGQRERFGASVLPDPIANGPYPSPNMRNPFDRIF